MEAFIKVFRDQCKLQSEAIPVGDTSIPLDEHQRDAMREIVMALTKGETTFS